MGTAHIDWDEVYPVYEVVEQKTQWTVEIELSDEERERIRRATVEFDAVQLMLRDRVQAASL